MANPWRIRAVRLAAEIPPFCVDTWLRSYRRSPWAGVVPNNLYSSVYGDTIRQLVERGSELLLAVHPEHPDMILGWLCYERTRDGKPVIHYAFTKSRYRHKGVMRSMMNQLGLKRGEPFYYTFKTPSARLLHDGRYAPDIARRRMP